MKVDVRMKVLELIIGLTFLFPRFSQAIKKNSQDLGFDPTVSRGLFRATQPEDVKYVPNEILIKFKITVSREEIAKILSKHNLIFLRDIPKLNLYKVKTPEGVSLKEMLRLLNEDKRIKYAQPNFIYKALGIGEDADYYQAIQLEKALEYLERLRKLGLISNVPVGVVDTGVMNHPDINFWVNPGEDLNGNGRIDPEEMDGIDNDGNGFVDDFYGWDFVDDDNDAQDLYDEFGIGHGTHVAGIISTLGEGVAQIMRVRAGGMRLRDEDIADSIIYAADNGAKVINLSLGGPFPSQVLWDAIKYAIDKGAVVVAAAGNSAFLYNGFPASFWDVLSVAATTADDFKTWFSTYNPQVDVSAPGQDILSSYYNNSYRYFSGTSMATPVVSGISALIFSLDKDLSPKEVMNLIVKSSDDIDENNPEAKGLIGKGRVNAYKAVVSAHKYIALKNIYKIIEQSAQEVQLDSGTAEDIQDFYRQKIEEILGQFPDEVRFSQKVVEFISNSVGDKSYAGEAGQIKWFLDLWKASEEDDFIKRAVATGLEEFSPQLVAEVIKNRKIEDMVSLMKKLETKFTAFVLSNLDVEMTAKYIEALGEERNTVELLAYLAGINNPAILLDPEVKKIIEEFKIPIEGIEDPRGPIELSDEYLAKLLENITNPNLKSALQVLYGLNKKKDMKIEEAVEILKNLSSEMVANILEWIEPEKAVEIVRKFSPEFVAQLLKDSNMLFILNIQDLLVDEEFVAEALNNLKAEEIARMWLAGKIDLFHQLDYMDAEKTAQVINSIYRQTQENPNLLRAYSTNVLEISANLFSELVLNTEKRDEIYKNLDEPIRNIWDVIFAMDKNKPDIKEIVGLINKIDDPAIKMVLPFLPVFRDIPSLANDFEEAKEATMSILREIGADELSKMVLAGAPFPLNPLLLMEEIDFLEDILSSLIKNIPQVVEDQYRQRAWVEGAFSILNFIDIFERGFADKVISSLTNMPEAEKIIANVLSLTDRVDSMVELISKLWEKGGIELLSKINIENSENMNLVFDTMKTILLKTDKGENLTEIDYQNLKKISQDMSTDVNGLIFARLSGDAMVRALVDLFDIDSEFSKSLLASIDKVPFWLPAVDLDFVKVSQGISSLVVKILSAGDLANSSKLLSKFELSYFPKFASLAYLIEAYFGEGGPDPEPVFGKSLEELKNWVEELGNSLKEQDPLKGEAYQLANLFIRKVIAAESFEDIDLASELGTPFKPVTKEEADRLNSLLNQIPEEEAIDYLFNIVASFFNPVNLISDLAFTGFSYEGDESKIDTKFIVGMLTKDPDFTLRAFFYSGNKSKEKYARLLDLLNTQQIIELVNNIPEEFPKYKAEFLMHIARVNAEKVEEVEESLTEDNPELKPYFELTKIINQIYAKEDIAKTDAEDIYDKFTEFKEKDIQKDFYYLFTQGISFEKGVKLILALDDEQAETFTQDREFFLNYLAEIFDPKSEEAEKLSLAEKAELITKVEQKLSIDLLTIAGFKQPELMDQLTEELNSVSVKYGNLAKAVKFLLRNSKTGENEEFSRGSFIVREHRVAEFSPAEVDITDEDIKAWEEVFKNFGPESFLQLLEFNDRWLNPASAENISEIIGFSSINPFAKLELYQKINIDYLKQILTELPESLAKYALMTEDSDIQKNLARVLLRLDEKTVAEWVKNVTQIEHPLQLTSWQLLFVSAYMGNEDLQFARAVVSRIENQSLRNMAEKGIELVELLKDLAEREMREEDVDKLLAFRGFLKDSFTPLLLGIANPKVVINFIDKLSEDQAISILNEIEDDYIVNLFDPENEKAKDIDLATKVKIFNKLDDKRSASLFMQILDMLSEKEAGEETISGIENALQGREDLKLDIFKLVEFVQANSAFGERTAPREEISSGIGSKSVNNLFSVFNADLLGIKEMKPDLSQLSKLTGIPLLSAPAELTQKKGEAIPVGGKVKEGPPPLVVFPEFNESRIAETKEVLENIYQQDKELAVYILNADNFEGRFINPLALAKLLLSLNENMRKELILYRDQESKIPILAKNLLAVPTDFNLLADLFKTLQPDELANILNALSNVVPSGNILALWIALEEKDENFATNVLNELDDNLLKEKINKGNEFVELLRGIGDSLEEDELSKIKTAFDDLGIALSTLMVAFSQPEISQRILLESDLELTKTLLEDPYLQKFVVDSNLSASSVADIFLRKENEIYIFNPFEVAQIYSNLYIQGVEETRIIDIHSQIFDQDSQFASEIIDALNDINPELADIILPSSEELPEDDSQSLISPLSPGLEPDSESLLPVLW